MTGPRARWVALATGAAVLLGGALRAGLDGGPFEPWVAWVIAGAVAAGPLVVLAALAWRRERPGRGWLALVLLLAVVVRLALLSAHHELSDDAARYHWDGKVLAHGGNPYLHAPDEPALAHLRIHALDARINHPWNRTCYPPLAELLFAAGYLLSPGRLTGLQLLELAAELITWLLLLGELRRRAAPPSRILLIAWAPLIVCEGYLPGHLDVLSLPLVTWFLLATARGQGARAGAALALASLVKPLPLIFVPAALRELGRRGGLRLALAGLGVGLLGYLPFARAGWKLFSSTWLMATEWSFNGSLGAWFETLLPRHGAHLLAAVAAALAILLGAWRGRELLSRMLLAQAAFVAFTPTLFPWYLIGMYPLLALRPDPALLALGILAPLAEQMVIGYHATGVWHLAAWARWAQYLPFYLLLAAGAWRGWGMFRRERP